MKRTHQKLGDICEVMSGNAWPAKQFNFARNGLPVIRIQNMEGEDSGVMAYWADDYEDKYLITTNDILLSLSGSFKVVRWSGNAALLNQRIMKLTPFIEVLDEDFFVYQLTHRLFEISGAATSTAIKNTSLTFLRSMDIWTPHIDEQRRIVARIKECMERVEEIKKLRSDSQDEAKQFLRSYYYELYEEFISVRPTQPLGNVGLAMGGGTPSKKRADFWDGDIPWVSPREMKRREISETSLSITAAAVEESAVRLIAEPSVMFVVRGMILAHTLPVAINRVPLTLNQDMKAIIPNPDFIVDYLATIVRGAERRILGMIEVAGHGTRRLQTEHWSSLPIPVLNREEQVAVISKVQEVEATADALLVNISLDEVSKLHDSILRKAFAGSL